MSDTTGNTSNSSALEQKEEDILTSEVSDEALEAAAEIPSTSRTSTCGFGCPC